MEFRPLSPAIGTEVTGVAVDNIDDASFREIRRVWAERGLLLFRSQALDGPALTRFSQRFGELELPPASERSTRDGAGVDGAPEVWLISNVIENGKPIGSLGAGEAEWHTDMSYLETPPSASLLFAREVPPAGGNTWFASMSAAAAALPAELRRAVDGRRARHDSSYTSAGDLRKGSAEVTDARQAPGAEHPILRNHPETGQACLFLGRRRNGYIAGLGLTESEALLDRLWAFCTDPDFTYMHEWRVGDLLVWDNRSVIHRRDAFDADARRVMMRTQVKGDRPY
jgi:alpha-ketoglutarate-dependent taurine dioxygenase